jgi:hypothetical protein
MTHDQVFEIVKIVSGNVALLAGFAGVMFLLSRRDRR